MIFSLQCIHDTSGCHIYDDKSECNCKTGCHQNNRLIEYQLWILTDTSIHYIVQIRSRNQREYRCCQEDRWRCLIHSGHDKCVKCNEYCCDHRCQEIAWLQCKYHNIDCPGKECSDTVIPYLLSSDLKPESKSRTCNRTGDQLDRYTVIQDKMIGISFMEQHDRKTDSECDSGSSKERVHDINKSRDKIPLKEITDSIRRAQSTDQQHNDTDHNTVRMICNSHL